MLAENIYQTCPSPVCMRSGCSTRDYVACGISHAEPIALPQLPDDIPKYYRDIVDACRAENPSDRPAAKEILQRFPFSSNLMHSQPQLPDPNIADISVLGKGLLMAKITCSSCWKWPVQVPFFHCNVCDLGDFDLCQTCYDRGLRCDHKDHLLVELGKIGSWIVPRKYHSCVKSSGTRDVLDLRW